MAWADESVPLLRTLVGDYESTIYTSDTLTKVLVVAAYQVYQQVDTIQEYSISIANQTISPDPTNQNTKDEAFLNLFTIKAACILDQGAALNAAKDALKITSHKHSFDTTSQAKFRLDLLSKGWCATYEETKKEFLYNNKTSVIGAAVLTPFRVYYNSHGRYHYGCFR